MTTWMLMAGIALASLGQQPVPDAQEVLRLLSEGREQLTTLEADFKQVTMTDDEDIKSTGTITYVKPKRIIFRYAEPPIEYMIDKNHAYEFDAELEQILIFNIEGRPEAEAFFLGLESNTELLQKSYTIRALPPENAEREAAALELIPKPIEDQEPICEKVTLQLRKVDYLPTKIDIINDESSNVTFTITNFKRNIDLPKERSHVFVPELTDVVLNDDAIEVVGETGTFFPDDERLGLNQEVDEPETTVEVVEESLNANQ